MNRSLTSVLFVLLGLSILFSIYIEEVVEPNTIESTTTTSTIAKLEVSSESCIRITDTEIERLRIAGVALDYHNNKWFFNDVFVGFNAFEDENFVACGEPDFISNIADIAFGE